MRWRGSLPAIPAAPGRGAPLPIPPAASGPGKGKGYSHDPFPSTYHAYPGAPTLLTNVTVLDGEGGRIDRGQVLFRDGKIVAVGQNLDAAGAAVIDGQGKYVTPA